MSSPTASLDASSSPASGTAYQSSDPKVIRVLPHGLLQIVGNGKTVLTVTNRGKQAALDVGVTVNDEPNEPPIADAGANKTVKAGSKVKLSGLKSRDAEGEALYYAWSQVRGSKIALLDVDNAEASFLAPTRVRDTDLSIQAEGDGQEGGGFCTGLCGRDRRA